MVNWSKLLNEPGVLGSSPTVFFKQKSSSQSHMSGANDELKNSGGLFSLNFDFPRFFSFSSKERKNNLSKTLIRKKNASWTF